MLKIGDGKSLSNVSFRVLDSRKIPHGVEYDIETLKEQGLRQDSEAVTLNNDTTST